MDDELLKLLELSPYDFDQSNFGWRKLDKKGKYLQAAKIIELYIAKHFNKIRSLDLSVSTMYFHAGQLYATEGVRYYKKAIRNFEQSYKDIPEWNCYVNGTIAFLRNDIENLKKYLDELKSFSNINYKWHVKFLKYCIKNLGHIDYKDAYEV